GRISRVQPHVPRVGALRARPPGRSFQCGRGAEQLAARVLHLVVREELRRAGHVRGESRASGHEALPTVPRDRNDPELSRRPDAGLGECAARVMTATDIALDRTAPRSGRAARRWAGHLFTLAFLGAWEAASLVAPSYLLPGAVQVALRLWSFVTSERDLGHLGASLFHVGAAIAISFVIGTLLAFISYYVPVLRFAIERRIGPFLNAFSAIGWTLLAIMWFGVTPLTVIFTISAVLVPFALVNMSAGPARIDPGLVELAASFTRQLWRGFSLVVVPSLYPFIFSPLRLLFGVAC